jgi:hypothetical protein
LIDKINELGLIPLIDASKIFIKMLNDSNYSTVSLANAALKKLGNKKLSILIVCTSPN